MKTILNKTIGNKTIRDGSIFAFFSFLNQGLNFFLLIVLSWYIMPSSYGKLNLFYTGVGVIGYVISLCTPGIIGIKYFKVKRNILSKYVNFVFLCTLGISILLFFAVLLFNEQIAKLSGIDPKLQTICIYFTATAVVYNLLLDIYRFEEKTLKYGYITTISTIINISASLLLVIVFKQDWYGRIEADFISSTIFFIIGFYILIKKKYITKEKPNKEICKETLAFGLPIIPHSINGWLRQGVDRYIINANFTSSAVGLFSFAINFSFIIYSVGAAFNRSNSVYIFKSLSEGEAGAKEKLRNQTIYLIAFYLCFSAALAIICWFLIPIIFPNYRESIIYILPLCISTFFQCVYLQFCNFLFYFKKTKNLMYITVSVSLIHMCSSLALTQYSVLYTAYISMFSSGLEALLIYLYSKKLYKFI